MNRRDIQKLRIHVGYPAITLIMPCEKEKIKKKFTELVSQADDKVSLFANVERHFDAMFDQLACHVDGGTIAIFVNKHSARFYFVPCKVEEVATCGQTFKLDILSAALNRLQRYWVIDCSAPEKNLFEGAGEHLMALEQTHVEMGKEQKKEIHFNDYLDQDRLPLCLVGSPNETENCLEKAAHRDYVVATVTAFEDVWSTMQNYFKKEQQRVMQELKKGEVGNEYVTGLHDVLKAARQGAVTQLLVEEGYHLDACEEHVTRQVVTEKALCPVGYQKIALVDQIVESVRSKGGAVFFVPNGTLNNYDRLVALIRFVA